MKIFKKVLFTFITIFLGLIVIYNIYNFISVKMLNKDVATVNGYAVLEVVSGSMEPTIHVGDMIIINTKAKEYQKDDIVTFYDNEGSFTTHRIVEINEDKVITKGDNNKSRDDEILTEKILGKYVFRIANFGRILASLKSPFTLIMILVVGILVCVLLSVDKEGNPILEEEEKEFLEYLNNKEKETKTLKHKK